MLASATWLPHFEREPRNSISPRFRNRLESRHEPPPRIIHRVLSILDDAPFIRNGPWCCRDADARVIRQGTLTGSQQASPCKAMPINVLDHCTIKTLKLNLWMFVVPPCSKLPGSCCGSPAPSRPPSPMWRTCCPSKMWAALPKRWLFFCRGLAVFHTSRVEQGCPINGSLTSGGLRFGG